MRIQTTLHLVNKYYALVFAVYKRLYGKYHRRIIKLQIAECVYLCKYTAANFTESNAHTLILVYICVCLQYECLANISITSTTNSWKFCVLWNNINFSRCCCTKFHQYLNHKNVLGHLNSINILDYSLIYGLVVRFVGCLFLVFYCLLSL